MNRTAAPIRCDTFYPRTAEDFQIAIYLLLAEFLWRSIEAGQTENAAFLIEELYG